MPSVADALRVESRREDARLTLAERIERAFALGESDLRIFMAASGLDRGAAERALRLRRQAGRRFSACIASIER